MLLYSWRMYNLGQWIHILEKCLPQFEDMQGAWVRFCENSLYLRIREYCVLVVHILRAIIGASI
jgi:hypothetical protein